MKFTGERFIRGQALGDIVVEHLQRYQSVSEFVKGKIVLDAACGEGYGSYIISNFADTVFGIDISNEAIEYARAHYNNSNLEYTKDGRISITNRFNNNKVFIGDEIILGGGPSSVIPKSVTRSIPEVCSTYGYWIASPL